MVNAKSANAFAKVRTLSLCKKPRTVRFFNKTKTLTCYKSAFYFMKKGEQRSPFCGERGYDGHIFAENRKFLHFCCGEGKIQLSSIIGNIIKNTIILSF